MEEPLIRALKEAVLWCLGKLRQLVAGPHAIAVLARTHNGLLLASVGDAMVGRRLCFNGCYDPELLDLLLSRCEASSQFLFVGANVGALVVPVAKRVRKVVAVEANPATFELLRLNVLLNRLQNVEVHCFAAGDKNGKASFLLAGVSSGRSHVEHDGRAGQTRIICEKPKRTSVEMKRLDDIFPDERFDWIVMDIEGSEPFALRGMENLLGRCRGLLTEVYELGLRQVSGMSREQYLSLLEPHFDEALFLPEKPDKGQVVSRVWQKASFLEMRRECCSFSVANVMFLRKAG
jgi:FkbM family methyltransferase